MKRRRTTNRLGTAGWLVSAAALGVGAGVALERLAVGRQRLRPDPYAGEDYGSLVGDRSYEVASFDGAILVSREVGAGAASAGAVFLHGFCLDHTIWHHQMKDLPGGKLRHIFYDARHHGTSRGGSSPTDTKILARDLAAVLDRSGLEQAVLVGHSMGGMTVLEFCREFPEEMGARIRGIVLVNTTYTDAIKTLMAAELIGPIERGARKIVEQVLRDPRTSRMMRLRGDDLSWTFVKLTGFGPRASPKQIEHVQRLLRCFPSPELIETLRGLRDFDMEEALAKIDVPALIIAGGDDRITTVRASRKIADEISGSRLVVLERTGHMAMLERHQEFTGLLDEFFDATLSEKKKTRRRAGGSTT